MIVWSLGEPKDQGYPLFAGDRFVGWITGWPQERDELMAALAERAERAAEVERLRGLLREAKSLLFATQHPTMDGSEHRAVKEFLARPLGL